MQWGLGGMVLAICVTLLARGGARSATNDSRAAMAPETNADVALEPRTTDDVLVGARPAPLAAPLQTVREPSEDADDDPDPAALDALLARDPAAALDQARKQDAAHPSSPHRAERRWVAIQALVHLEQIGAARAEAYAFYADFPGDARAAPMEAMTGMHRGRLGPRP